MPRYIIKTTDDCPDSPCEYWLSSGEGTTTDIGEAYLYRSPANMSYTTSIVFGSNRHLSEEKL